MTEEERRLYWKHAMDQGLGSRLIPKHFTTVGKMKVKRDESTNWILGWMRFYHSMTRSDVCLIRALNIIRLHHIRLSVSFIGMFSIMWWWFELHARITWLMMGVSNSLDLRSRRQSTTVPRVSTLTPPWTKWSVDHHQSSECKIFANNVYTLSSFEDDIFNFLILISPSKLDPEGPAYAKMMKSKKFDPRKSQVLEVCFFAGHILW